MLKKQLLKMCIASLLLVTMLTSVCACATLAPPQKNLKSAYKTSVDQAVEKLDVFYDKQDAYDLENISIDCNLDVELSSSLLNLLNSTTDQDWSWINDVDIQLSEISKDKKIAVDAALKFKDKQLIAVNTVADIASGNYFLAVPLLTSKYLDIDTKEMMDLDVSWMSQDMNPFKILPEQQVLEKLIYKYFDIVMERIDDVEKSEATLTANNVSEKCSSYDVTLTQLDIVNIVLDVVTAAKEDKDIKNIIYSAVEYINEVGTALESGYSPESPVEIYAEFVEGCNDFIEDTNESISDGDIEDVPAMEIQNYVNSKNEIIGIDVYLISDSESIHIFAGKADDGENIGTELFFDNYNGQKLFELLGTSEENKDLLSGTYEFIAEDESLLFIDIEDLNTKLLDQGYLNGSIILSPSSDLIDMVEDEMDADAAAAGLALSSISLKLDFEQENDNNFKLAMHIMSGRNAYASVTLDTAIAKGKSISLPKDSTEDTEEWVADFDFNALLDVVNESELPDFIVELVETYVMLLQWS